MSLRFVGNQSLQTPPSPMLAGASTVSLSMWVRINPGSSVANAGGTRIFGDGAGRLSVVLSGPASLKVAWTPAGAGLTFGGSGYSQDLTAGAGHHLAVTWQDGLQRYFLDGQVVATDSQHGTLGNPGGAPAPFRLGSDSAGVDVTVDEPTLWVGYALTGSDVVNLRDRVVAPSAVAPASIALRWSLSGPDGVPAAAGDPGLADGSASKLNLATVVGGAPAYAGGDLSYQAPAKIGSICVAPSGRMIVVNAADAAGVPAKVASLQPTDDIQVLLLVNEPAGGSFTLGFSGQATSPVPVVRHSPDVSATWVFGGLTPGTPYYIRCCPLEFDQAFSSSALFEVFDGDSGPRLQAGVIDLSGKTTYSTDYAAQGSGFNQGYTAIVKDSPTGIAAVPVTPTGASLVIRLTGPNGDLVTVRTMMCSPHGPSTLFLNGTPGSQYYSDGDERPAFFQSLQQATLLGNWGNGYARASGLGDYYSITNAAATVQSALLGLAGGKIPAGGVSVTGPDTGPIRVHFTGPMAGASQPTIAASDPAVTVLHDGTGGGVIGGQFSSIVVDGGAPVPLKDVLWGAGQPDASGNRTTPPYLASLVYPLPGGLTIAPSSSVKFSGPAGFFSTSAGPVSTVTATPVTNPGSILPPFAPDQKTMKVGYNIEGDYYGDPPRVYSNLIRGTGIANLANVNGYPTLLSGYSVEFNVVDIGIDYGGAGKGINACPQGQYTILWDGGNTFSVFPQTYTLTSNVVSTNITGGAGNSMVIDLRDPANFSPAFGLRLDTSQNLANPDGTYPCNLQNLRIYPPDPADPSGNTPWANPPKYYPTLAAQFAGAACFRTMDALATNASNVVDYSDFVTPASFGYRATTKQVFAHVSRVEAYTGPDTYTTSATNTPLLFTTSTPHGLVNGQTVGLSGIGTVTTASGGFDPSGLVTNARVLSPTTFVIAGPPTPPSSVMTNVLTPTSGYATMNVTGGGIPFQDCVDLANHLNCDLWLNVPHLATDACVGQMAAYVAAHLNPNLKVHVEWSNECWNFAFQQFYHLVGMSRSFLGTTGGGDYAPYQVYRSAQVHKIFTDTFTSAGLPTSRLRRVIGSSPGGGGTQYIINVMNAAPSSTTVNGVTTTTTIDLSAGTTTSTTNGVTTTVATFPPLAAYAFDEIATNFYLNVDPIPEQQFRPIFDALDLQQNLDMIDLIIANGNLRDEIASHTQVLAGASLATKPDLVLYEGGWQSLLPLVGGYNDLTQTPDMGHRIHALQYHPRLRASTLGMLQGCQDAGAKLANIFYLNGSNYYAAWNTYFGHSMRAGTGTEAGASNVTDPTNIPNVRSVVGGAVNQWTSMLAPGNTAPTIKRVIPGRSARPRAIGYRAW